MNNTPDTERDWISLARETLDIEIEGLQAVRENIGPSFNRAMSVLASCRGRVVVTGLGKSGLVGRKLAATFSSTGTPSFFLHPVEGQHGDLGGVRDDDVIIAISNSGKTDELIAIFPVLRSLGVKIISLTGGMDSPMAQMSDVVINTAVPREACPLNLAPTSSTTAVLAMGDALAVCLIEAKAFTENDFRRFHPGGALGQRLGKAISEIMQERVPAVPDSANMGAAVDALHLGGLGAVLVLDDDGAAKGILTDGDLRRAILNKNFTPAGSVTGIMTKKFRHATQSMTVAEVLDIMESAAIMVMPVLDEKGLPLGIIHMHDLLGKGQIKFKA